MKVLLIVISIGGALNIKYYLSFDYILVEHLDVIVNEKTYYLLEIDESKIHHVDKKFSQREVSSYHPSHLGKWNSTSREERYVGKSKKYFFQGNECINRRFEIIIPSDSLLNIADDSVTRIFIMNKVYGSLPLISKYITDKNTLKFLSIYNEFEDGFNFCLNSYYEDTPLISVGTKVEKVEEILVEKKFFDKFFLVEESNAK